MKILYFSLFFSFIEFGQSASDSVDSYVSYQPEQVHIALGENPDEMVITWSTMQDPGNCFNLMNHSLL